MQLPQDHRVHFTDLHDALTSMRFHGKQIPKVSPCLFILLRMSPTLTDEVQPVRGV